MADNYLNSTGLTQLWDIIKSTYVSKSDAVGKKTPEGGEIFNNYTDNSATGECSHAEGAYTTAVGLNSHVEGGCAVGSGIIPEDILQKAKAGTLTALELYNSGENDVFNLAFGAGSHAEGSGTYAYGMGSHAEGGTDEVAGTYALGDFSHAEGYNTVTWDTGSHSEGMYTSSYNFASHAEGSGTTASGQYGSHAEGSGTTASGHYGSHAEGNRATASGDSSHAEGNNTTASGDSSHAEGNNTVASEYNSHAEGCNTKSIGVSSHAEGQQTSASEKYSHAEGHFTTALGQSSHAEGHNSSASGWNSHAEGLSTGASGWNSHAEGHFTVANGESSHAEGSETSANGNFSHVEGSNNRSLGASSHAEGAGNNADGQFSHVEGGYNIANAIASHAEGLDTTSSNGCAHAEGLKTAASGYASHAEGNRTTSIGDYSHAEGGNLTFIKSTANIISGINKIIIDDIDSIFNDLKNPLYTIIGIKFYKSTGESIYISSQECRITVQENFNGYNNIIDMDGVSDSKLYFFTSGLYNIIVFFNKIHVTYLGASGIMSHAEGSDCSAVGDMSHAEGTRTVALGESSHAEGHADEPTKINFIITSFIPDAPNVPGTLKLEGDYQNERSGNVPNPLFIRNFSRIQTNGKEIFVKDVVFDGTYSTLTFNDPITTGDFPASGEQSYVVKFGGLATGKSSHSEGSNNQALGDFSHAEGNKNTVLGPGSHIEGNKNIIYNNSNFSHVEGGGNIIKSGSGNHIEGTSNLVNSGNANHIEGSFNEANGSYNHISGQSNKAYGVACNIGGLKSTSFSTGSYVNGFMLNAGAFKDKNTNQIVFKKPEKSEESNYTRLGDFSHIEGWGQQNLYLKGPAGATTYEICDGMYKNSSIKELLIHQLNNGVQVYHQYPNGQYDFFWIVSNEYKKDTDQFFITLNKTIDAVNPIDDTGIGPQKCNKGVLFSSLGASSHVEGAGNHASGEYSHAEGGNTAAKGEASHTEGNFTLALGTGSHAEGAFSFAEGYGSHSEGGHQLPDNTIIRGGHAKGNSSHAEGYGTIASGEGSHAEGKYNVDNVNWIHTVGIGTSSARKNAHTITTDGKHYIPGIGTYKGTETTLPTGQDLATIVNGKAPISHGNHVPTIQTANNTTFLRNDNTWHKLTHSDLDLGTMATKSSNDYVQKSGDSMSGNLIFSNHKGIYGTNTTGSNYLILTLDKYNEVRLSNGIPVNIKGQTKINGNTDIKGLLSCGSSIASGVNSFSSGMNTEANGARSAAFGVNTQADGTSSFASGDATYAYADSSFSSGVSTHACNQASHSEGKGSSTLLNVIVTSLGAIVPPATKPSSFVISGDQSSNIHKHDVIKYSAPIVASGPSVDCFNYVTNVIVPSGGTTTTIEVSGDLYIQSSTTAQYISVLSGVAYGYCSHVEGQMSKAIGPNTHAEGYYTIAGGGQSHAEGYQTRTKGPAAHAEGIGTEALGNFSHAEGCYTNANDECSHAEGSNCTADKKFSHAEGFFTAASGYGAHSEGVQCDYIYLAGAAGSTRYQVVAGKNDSNAFTNLNKFFSLIRNTIGWKPLILDSKYNTLARVINIEYTSNPESLYLTLDKTLNATEQEKGRKKYYISLYQAASAEGSHISGVNSSASGIGSHSCGVWIESQNMGEFACGKYNQSNSDTIFSIGMGSSWNDRKNAVEVKNNGNTRIYGNLHIQGGSTSGNRLDFGDYNYCFIHEDTSDHMKLYAQQGFKFTGGSQGVHSQYGFYDDSDERLKNFKGDIKLDFNKLKQIPKKYFTWKEDETNKLNLGTSAQEVQKVYPEIVSEDKDGILAVDYAKLSIVALKAVDELHDENEKLKSRLKAIEDKLAKLNL